ncbi:Mu transposase C-terminal domain-containing protein [Actinomadura litoris]|uniref:Mu transposase C-terminal domain-containing protein n=1 Tax=Actinomadura litoris TaxID=2678616 RepID=UPI003557D0CF
MGLVSPRAEEKSSGSSRRSASSSWSRSPPGADLRHQDQEPGAPEPALQRLGRDGLSPARSLRDPPTAPCALDGRGAVPDPDAPSWRKWSEIRQVTKTATVRLFGNPYEVDASLVGRKIKLVFDPFDLEVMEVRFRGEPTPRPRGAGSASTACGAGPILYRPVRCRPQRERGAAGWR